MLGGRARAGALALVGLGLAVLPCTAAASASATPVPSASASPDPAPAQPGVGIRLLDAPVARRDDPRARIYVVDQVRPGAAFTRRVEVSNGTDEPQRLLLYGATAGIEDGLFTVAARGEPGPVAGWTTVAPDQLTLAPGARASVAVVVRVPADTVAGEVLRRGRGGAAPHAGSGRGRGRAAGRRAGVPVRRGGGGAGQRRWRSPPCVAPAAPTACRRWWPRCATPAVARSTSTAP